MLKFRRILLKAVGIAATLVMLSSCSVTGPNGMEDAVTARVVALKGATAIGMVKMMDAHEADAQENPAYSFEILGTADEAVARLTGGEADIAAIPANLAATLYNKTEGGIKVCAVNTLGVLYIVDTSGTISTIEDLRGKTLLSPGKGSVPEYALNYVLERNSLTPGTDVNIEFKSEATEIGALLLAGEAETALLPEPYVTTVVAQNPDVKIVMSLSDEWDKVQPDFGFITGVLVVKTDFAEKHEAALDQFLKEYKSSIEFTKSDVKKTAELTVKYGIVPKEPIAEQSIPRCNIVFMDGQEMKSSVNGYLGTLFEAEPKSIGGKLPGDDFYRIK